jgi:hypothetical protein
MGILSKYVCSTCNLQQSSATSPGPRVYELSDGSRIEVRTTKAWCFDCGHLRTVEDLSVEAPLEELRRAANALTSASDRRSWFRTQWSCDSFHWLDAGAGVSMKLDTQVLHDMGELIEQARRQLAYLAARTVPARCLHCEGHHLQHDAVISNGEKHGYPHPGCSGVLYFEITGHINYGRCTIRKVYGQDGMYLRDEPYEDLTLQRLISRFE